MKTFKFLILSISIFLLLLLQSCKKDPCETVLCENSGTCEEGICDCLDGYEGSTCAILWRDKILGEYTLTEECTWGDFGPFDLTSEADPSDDKKVLLDLDYDYPIKLTMTSSTAFDVPRQSVCDSCPEFYGSGNSTSDGFTFTFSFDSGESCVDTYVRK